MEQYFCQGLLYVDLFLLHNLGIDYARKPCSILGYSFSYLHTFHQKALALLQNNAENTTTTRIRIPAFHHLFPKEL